MNSASMAPLAFSIRDILKARGGKMLLSQVLSLFQTDREKALAELNIMRLTKLAVVRMKKFDNDYLLLLTEPASQSEGSISNFRVVATLPFSVQDRTHQTQFLGTEEAFDYLLSAPKSYVKLSLPFPEEPIIVHFTSKIQEMAKKGIRVHVLTRQIGHEAEGYNYLMLVKSVRRMWDIYRSAGSEHLFNVRTFHRAIKTFKTNWVHYESTHAKIVSIDGEKCYVGSAEFRINSLYNNFEVGSVFSGQCAKQVETIYDLVWEKAKPVTYNSLIMNESD